jgi:hypothetical protein
MTKVAITTSLGWAPGIVSKPMAGASFAGLTLGRCGQSISIGIADLGLPIPPGSVHCPYCRHEDIYLEQDRIEFDMENGLPLINPA